MVELQDYERALEPDLPEGQQVADAYLAHLADRCRQYDGRVFVAAAPEDIAGFVCVLAVVPADAPDDPAPYAYVSDLVVRATYRRRGVARALLRAAEDHARSRGARVLRVGVLAVNEGAHQLYRVTGFRDYHVQLQKRL